MHTSLLSQVPVLQQQGADGGVNVVSIVIAMILAFGDAEHKAPSAA